MAVRGHAHEDGVWVREAALAHARKRAERAAAAKIAAE
jgi:ring-1,2-phenylacetyl-CoA epoxidase subunit PaaA